MKISNTIAILAATFAFGTSLAAHAQSDQAMEKQQLATTQQAGHDTMTKGEMMKDKMDPMPKDGMTAMEHTRIESDATMGIYHHR